MVIDGDDDGYDSKENVDYGDDVGYVDVVVDDDDDDCDDDLGDGENDDDDDDDDDAADAGAAAGGDDEDEDEDEDEEEDEDDGLIWAAWRLSWPPVSWAVLGPPWPY
eukprot:1017881-Pyramimonas_sp.AAC.1